MALISESLSVWEISFRWAGLDPDRIWFRVPLPVRDNFRLLMEAVLSGEILCETLTLAKLPPGSKADPRFYIRTYIDDVYACIHGKRYSRNLLKWAMLNRMDFLTWCKAREIPPPEFWFPKGWKLEFDITEELTPALFASHVEPDLEGNFHIRYDTPRHDQEEVSPKADQEKTKLSEENLRKNQITRIACQQIASVLWKDDPSRTIASIVKDDLIQKYAGACYYQNDTVRGWIKEIAPREVRNRRGRPRKNGDKGGTKK